MEPKSIVLWAVDPFAGESKTQKEAARAIMALERRRRLLVQPVYVAASPLPNLPESFREEVYREIRAKAQAQLHQILRGIKLRSVLPLAVLPARKNSVSERVTTVLAYAEQTEPELIIASTHARRGPARWFLGSFAESLTLRSPFPLFLVNPTWKKIAGFKEILFPTDFSDASRDAFERVLEFAAKMESRIHIFHKFVFEFAPSVDFAFTASALYGDLERDELKATEARIKRWEKEARVRGVVATSEVDQRVNDSVADAILRRSRRGSYLIALASRSGVVQANLIGSVTRRVIRESLVPVWVVHPEAHARPVVRRLRAAA